VKRQKRSVTVKDFGDKKGDDEETDDDNVDDDNDDDDTRIV